MQLVIIDDKKEVHLVTEGIEEYNLEKQLARAEIADNVHAALMRLRKHC
jgi:hypothetical protein